MHTSHSNTQYKNESSTVKWAQWDKTQSRELLVCSNVCASHCAQLLHTILYRTDLIVFPLTLQAITTAWMMSIWGRGCKKQDENIMVCPIPQGDHNYYYGKFTKSDIWATTLRDHKVIRANVDLSKLVICENLACVSYDVHQWIRRCGC